MALTIHDIKQVLIVGSGTLGLRIGLQCALSGFHTSIYDIQPAAFGEAKKAQAKILSSLIKRNVLSAPEAAAAQERIRWTNDLQLATQGVDFVSESVTEDVAIKKKVWQELSRYCPKHAVLTTNTSSLLPSQFAQESGNPAHFCAFHFHDVFWANVVDIMPHATTAGWVVDLLKEMAVKLNQIPVILKKETPAYVFNAILAAILDTAGLLVADGKASIQDVDRSWMGNFKTVNGPFGMLDLIGLDTAWHVSVARDNRESQRFATFLKQYIDQGKLGVKTGEGFYQYPDPEYKNRDFLKGV